MAGRPRPGPMLKVFVKIPFGADERRRLPRPSDPADYERPVLDGSGESVVDRAMGTTPDGGYREFPPAVLRGCTDPLAPGAPDLRGVWECHKGAMKGHFERIEQAGNRVCITAGGVVHDMFVTGSMADGVNDVSGPTGGGISVAADFKDGRLNLRPGGGRAVFVTRYLDGDEMIWRYGPYRNRLHRLTEPPAPGGSTPTATAHVVTTNNMTVRSAEWTRTAPVTVSASREMRATNTAVFDALCDHESWPEWFDALSAVERIGDQHEGVGSRRRVHIGGRVVVDEEFIVWEPDKAWGFSVHSMKPRALLKSLNELVTIQETGPDRVRVTYTMAMEPGRTVGLLLRAGVKKQLTKNLGTALENLGARLGAA